MLCVCMPLMREGRGLHALCVCMPLMSEGMGCGCILCVCMSLLIDESLREPPPPGAEAVLVGR